MSRIENLTAALELALGGKLSSVTTALGEVTAVVKADDLLAVTTALRDVPELRFEQLLDLCGVDYSAYGGVWEGQRYAVVYHLLSLTHNWRLRLRTFARDDDLPVLESVIGVWPAANWLEREVWDLFGVVFTGHPNMDRILTADDWEGHPLRKDYPVQVKLPVKTYAPLQLTEEEFRANVEADRRLRRP